MGYVCSHPYPWVFMRKTFESVDLMHKHEVWVLQHARPVTHIRWIDAMQSSVKNVYSIFITYISAKYPQMRQWQKVRKSVCSGSVVRWVSLDKWNWEKIAFDIVTIIICVMWIMHVNAMSLKRNLLHLKCRIDSIETNNKSIVIFGEMLFVNSW